MKNYEKINETADVSAVLKKQKQFNELKIKFILI